MPRRRLRSARNCDHSDTVPERDFEHAVTRTLAARPNGLNLKKHRGFESFFLTTLAHFVYVRVGDTKACCSMPLIFWISAADSPPPRGPGLLVGDNAWSAAVPGSAPSPAFFPVGLGLAAAASIDLSLATPAASMAWTSGVSIASPAAVLGDMSEATAGVSGVLPFGDLISSCFLSVACGLSARGSVCGKVSGAATGK